MSHAHDELIGALIGLGGTITRAMDQIEGFVPCGNPAAVVLGGLATWGNGGVEDRDLEGCAEQARGFIQHVSEHRGVEACPVFDASELTDADRALIDGLAKAAVEASCYLMQGSYSDEINAYFYRALASIGKRDADEVAKATDFLPEANRRISQLTTE